MCAQRRSHWKIHHGACTCDCCGIAIGYSIGRDCADWKYYCGLAAERRQSEISRRAHKGVLPAATWALDVLRAIDRVRRGFDRSAPRRTGAQIVAVQRRDPALEGRVAAHRLRTGAKFSGLEQRDN